MPINICANVLTTLSVTSAIGPVACRRVTGIAEKFLSSLNEEAYGSSSLVLVGIPTPLPVEVENALSAKEDG